jgi:hypothetical protein
MKNLIFIFVILGTHHDSIHKFPLAPMGALAPGSSHARPSAQAPIKTSEIFYGAIVAISGNLAQVSQFQAILSTSKNLKN